MSTKVDTILEQFMISYLNKDFVSDIEVQALLDQTREAYDFDVVFVFESVGNMNEYQFSYVSAKKPEYAPVLEPMTVTEEEYNELREIYRENNLSDRVLEVHSEIMKTPKAYLHFGIIENDIYRGAVGCFSKGKHRWTKEDYVLLLLDISMSF